MPIGVLLLQPLCARVQCIFVSFRLPVSRKAWQSSLAFEELVELARLQLFCNRNDFGCMYGTLPLHINRIFRLSIIIASDRCQLDFPGAISISVMAAILATTIQAQDFQDIIGDKAVGRYTFPIAFPNFSRYTLLVTPVMWSLYLVTIWEITTPACVGFIFLGITVGIRFYFWRSTKDDEWSYVLYNVSCFPFAYFQLLNGSFFIDLVDSCICDTRLLAHVWRECCSAITSDWFRVGIFYSYK